MGKITSRDVFVVLALMGIWVILAESFAPIHLISGFVLSVFSIVYTKKYIPLKRIENVSFKKIIWLIFYLIGQLYLSGIVVAKIIFTGGRTDVVEVKTKLKDDSLRALLADTITITPGSIMLDLNEDKILVVWLRDKREKDIEDLEDPMEELAGGLERIILRAEEGGKK